MDYKDSLNLPLPPRVSRQYAANRAVAAAELNVMTIAAHVAHRTIQQLPTIYGAIVREDLRRNPPATWGELKERS